MNYLHKFIIYLFSPLLIVSSSLSHAEQIVNTYSHPLAISELLDIALNNNPETHAAWWNARRASASASTTKSAYYPTIGARGTVAHGRDYKFINGQTTTYTTASGDLFLTYLLYDFGERRAACEAAREALAAANWQSDWALQKVMYQVIHNAYAYLNAKEQLNARMTSLEDAINSLEAAKDLHQVGLRSINDVYTLQATVSELQIGIAMQKAETDIAKGKLCACMGLSIDTDLLVADLPDPQINKVSRIHLQQLIDAAHQRRADLMAKRAEVAQKLALQDKVKKSTRPKLSFNGDTGYRRYIEDNTNGYNYNVGLYLDIPLFNGFEATYQNRIAYSNMRISEAELETLETDIALEVLTYSSWFEAAQEILALSHENLQNSFKAFQGVQDKYKIGTQSIFDLTTAQQQLAAARIKHAEAKTRWYRSLAQLAYATGTIMPNTEVPCITAQ